jgi:CheY-like chemotaxis protein
MNEPTDEPQATVLTVEDSDNIRRLVAYNLKRAGYEVLEAADGKQAVKVLQKIVPDLIILDIRMPEMDGFQLLELMRRYPKAAAIPVIMMTALSQPQNVDRALKLGVIDYLVKPLDPKQLIAKVKEALSSEGREGRAFDGPNRRNFRRASIEDIELSPQPGGTGIDIGEGGIAWRSKMDVTKGDVIDLEAPQLFEALDVTDSLIRARILSVRPVGLGYNRIGAAFIGLSPATRDAIRRFLAKRQNASAE